MGSRGASSGAGGSAAAAQAPTVALEGDLASKINGLAKTYFKGSHIHTELGVFGDSSGKVSSDLSALDKGSMDLADTTQKWQGRSVSSTSELDFYVYGIEGRTQKGRSIEAQKELLGNLGVRLVDGKIEEISHSPGKWVKVK